MTLWTTSKLCKPCSHNIHTFPLLCSSHRLKQQLSGLSNMYNNNLCHKILIRCVKHVWKIETISVSFKKLPIMHRMMQWSDLFFFCYHLVHNRSAACEHSLYERRPVCLVTATSCDCKQESEQLRCSVQKRIMQHGAGLSDELISLLNLSVRRTVTSDLTLVN